MHGNVGVFEEFVERVEVLRVRAELFVRYVALGDLLDGHKLRCVIKDHVSGTYSLLGCPLGAEHDAFRRYVERFVSANLRRDARNLFDVEFRCCHSFYVL